MNNTLIFASPVFRSNLFYDVWFLDILPDYYEHLKQFIKKFLGPNDDTIPKVIIIQIDLLYFLDHMIKVSSFNHI